MRVPVSRVQRMAAIVEEGNTSDVQVVQLRRHRASVSLVLQVALQHHRLATVAAVAAHVRWRFLA